MSLQILVIDFAARSKYGFRLKTNAENQSVSNDDEMLARLPIFSTEKFHQHFIAPSPVHIPSPLAGIPRRRWTLTSLPPPLSTSRPLASPWLHA
jgi:hypothetical protein